MDRSGKRYKKRHKGKNPGLERTPLDMEIAKYLRFKVPRKSTMMQKQAVEYFVGSKAVDALMESKWAERKKGIKQTFVLREDAEKYLNELLQKQFFYRVMKNEKEQKNKDAKEEGKEEPEKSKIDEEETKNTEVPETKLRKRKVKKTEANEEDKNEDSESKKTKGKTKSKTKTKEKKSKEKVKKRYKLTYHDDQVFLDSKDIYIWLYNPVSWKTIIMGMGVLLLVVAGTLFPLWPPQVRIGVYYLSVAGGVFIGSLFGVAIARTILYGVIWVFTGGKHHLWILPNILADVGFFESFQPWYSYEYKGSTESEDDEDEEKEDDEEEEEGQESDEEPKDQNSEERENDEKGRHSQSEHSAEASGSESPAE